MPDRFRLLAGLALVVGGLAGVGLGGGVLLQAWYGAWAFERSGQAARLEQQTSTLESPPLWIDEPQPPDGAAPGPAVVLAAASPSPTPRLADPAALAVAGVEFRFADPPEPGAHARLSVELRSQAAEGSAPIDVASAATWFAGYRVIGAVPPVLNDHTTPDGVRHFTWPGPAPGATARLELHLKAVEDDVAPPDVTVSLDDGRQLAQVTPRTISPRPRPGPARALSIPKLQLKSGVVQTEWEPPPFVIGQLAGTANLSQGNTVLIGHYRGSTGNVFERLDRLQPGDEVIAVSRGLEYRFIVSGTAVLPRDDNSPLAQTESPRLTLMTCIGRWDPLARDYEERLWVIAEPPELAQQTIAYQAELTRQAADEHARVVAQATAEAREAEALAAAQATATAERLARPTATPTPAATATPLPRAGAAFRDPAVQSRDGRRVTVRGRVSTPVNRGLHLWLFWQPVDGNGPWWPAQDEIVPRSDGTWEIEIDLEDQQAERYVLRVGTLEPGDLAALKRFVGDHPDRPLADLPAGFTAEAAIYLNRNR